MPSKKVLFIIAIILTVAYTLVAYTYSIGSKMTQDLKDDMGGSMTTTLTSWKPYQVAIYEIEHNKDILSEVGAIKGYGESHTGEINIHNGKKKSYLKIDVLGEKKNLTVEVFLTRDKEWKVIKLNKFNRTENIRTQ